jgi:hypothetical protein
LGAENCEERQPKRQRAILLEHLDKIRHIDGFHKCMFIIMPESNFALESSHIEESLKQSLAPSEYHIIREDKEKAGFLTDTQLKEMGTNILKSLIDYGEVRFHANFFTCPSGSNLDKYMQDYKMALDLPQYYLSDALNNPQSEARANILEIAKVQLKEEIVRQLKDWKEEVILDKRQIPKRFYSGKYGNKPDDLAMCLVGGMVMVKKWRNSIREGLTGMNGLNPQNVTSSGYSLTPQNIKW